MNLEEAFLNSLAGDSLLPEPQGTVEVGPMTPENPLPAGPGNREATLITGEAPAKGLPMNGDAPAEGPLVAGQIGNQQFPLTAPAPMGVRFGRGAVTQQQSEAAGGFERPMTALGDVGAGFARGAVTQTLGIGGDLESLWNGLTSIFNRPEDQSRLEAFIAGLQQPTNMATSEQVSKEGFRVPLTNINVPALPSVVPAGAPDAQSRQFSADIGQQFGELAPLPGAIEAGTALIKGTAKKLGPTAADMMESQLRKAGAIMDIAPGAKSSRGRQTDTTQTPRFKEWFGQSKVVNKENKPLLMYHGTQADFDKFDRSKIQLNFEASGGFWFTPDRGAAEQFGRDGGRVMEVYLKIENPLTYEADPDLFEQVMELGQIHIDELPAYGYDGVVGESFAVVPAPEQIMIVSKKPVGKKPKEAKPKASAFDKWFKDSKVVDDQGKPLLLYHSGDFDANVHGAFSNYSHFGTEQAAYERALTVFIKREAGAEQVTQIDGRYFLDEDRWPLAPAKGFASESDARSWLFKSISRDSGLDLDSIGEPNITTVYLNIKNPKRVKDQGENWEEAIAKAKAEGHDGIVYRNEFEDKGSDSYIVFDPKQVKSVDNRGTFDSKNPNVLYGGAAAGAGDATQNGEKK